MATVGRGQMPPGPEPAEGHVDHLHGGELLEDRAGRESGRQIAQAPGEGDVQAVSQEGDEDMGLDAVFALMVDRPDGQRVP